MRKLLIGLSFVVLVLAACTYSPEGSTTVAQAPTATPLPQATAAAPTATPAAPTATVSAATATAVPQATTPTSAPVITGTDQWPAGLAPVNQGAGMAPQTPADAARVLQVSPEDAMLLTNLNPRPGDSTVIGWVLGTKASEGIGKRVAAGHLPAGTCVDYDPNPSRVEGTIARYQDFTSQWRRVLLANDGKFTGLKATVYWTPCEFTASIVPTQNPMSLPTSAASVQQALQPLASANVPNPNPAPAAVAPEPEPEPTCANTSDKVAALFARNAAPAYRWNPIEGSGNSRWVYNGPRITITVPDGYTMDYDAGGYGRNAEAGKPLTGIVFTLNPADC